MPRRFIKRLLPHHSEIKEHKYLKHLGEQLHDPNLWHLNRHSVSKAVAVGLFLMYVPVPFQMLLAALVAIWLRINLPIAVVLVWISNPFTMPPMFYAAYKLGAWITGHEPQPIQFEISWEWLSTSLSGIWEPFLLGCFISASLLSIAGYFASQLLWRIITIRNWRRRNGKKAPKQPIN